VCRIALNICPDVNIKIVTYRQSETAATYNAYNSPHSLIDNDFLDLLPGKPDTRARERDRSDRRKQSGPIEVPDDGKRGHLSLLLQELYERLRAHATTLAASNIRILPGEVVYNRLIRDSWPRRGEIQPDIRRRLKPKLPSTISKQIPTLTKMFRPSAKSNFAKNTASMFGWAFLQLAAARLYSGSNSLHSTH
jgi:hypothetical protein